MLESYFNALHGGSNDPRSDDRIDQEDSLIFLEGVKRTKEHVLGVADGCFACLICLERIGPTEPIWTCCGERGDTPPCYVVLHLCCIQSWAKQQLSVRKNASLPTPTPAEAIVAVHESGSGPSRPPTDDDTWACPKCRKEYMEPIPVVSRCFCGATTDPPFDPWNIPHSCGEPCCRRGACGHQCLLLCHPGPCAPCPREVECRCYCGKETSRRRCGRREFSCMETCGARLPCGHVCSATCHPGPHPPCTLSSEATCPCGEETKEIPCVDRGSFRCHRACNKLLNCGIHRCEAVCCSGCPMPCPFAGKKTCPCGKLTHTDARCGTVVGSCGQTCDKLLPCGRHRCEYDEKQMIGEGMYHGTSALLQVPCVL